MRWISRLLLLSVCSAVYAQEAALPSNFYDRAKEGDKTTCDVTITTTDPSGQASEAVFEVDYLIEAVLPRSITVRTERRVKLAQGYSRDPRILSTRFRFKDMDFRSLMVELKTVEGWENLQIETLKVIGDAEVVIGTKKFNCQQIQFDYSGRLDGKLVEVKEMLWYSDARPAVMPFPKIVSNLVITMTTGVYKQRLELLAK